MELPYRPRILVPLDGSKLARSTLEEILPLARAADGSLTLIAVMEPIMDHHFEPYAHAEEVSITEAIETYLAGEARQVAADSLLDVDCVLVPGFGERPGELIAKYASDNGYDT